MVNGHFCTPVGAADFCSGTDGLALGGVPQKAFQADLDHAPPGLTVPQLTLASGAEVPMDHEVVQSGWWELLLTEP